MMHTYSRLLLVEKKIDSCLRFLEDDHPEELKKETTEDLVYWREELAKMTDV